MMGKLRKMSKTYYLRQIVACLLVYCILLAVPAQVAMADSTPTDGVGPSTGTGGYTATLLGTATTNTAGTVTTINVLDNGTVFDWQNFDIGSGHTVEHPGMDAAHAVLHRINVTTGWGDGEATGINGSLDAPGYLFVVNPMGIVMGADALITANRFVASGLDISNFSDFVGGVTNELQFEGYDTGTLGVELQAGGQISASAVALIGKTVVNDGTINSDSVVLAAGERVYLAVTDDSGKLAVDVTDLLTTVPSDNTVTNTGTINATDGNVLLAAGDIYSLAVSGVEDLAAVANGSDGWGVILDGDFVAGEITLEGDYDSDGNGNVIAIGTLTSTTGDIEISASDNTIILGDDVDAAVDLLLNNDTQVSPDKTLKAGQDVILADGKTMDGTGGLTVEADRDIVLGGAVTADGTLTLKADADTVDNEQGATTGGIMWATNTLLTTAGDIDIYGNAILLDNDVTSAGDLILNNKTNAAANITLKAGNNVDSKSDLNAQGNLTIEAGDLTSNPGGEIIAKRIDMDSVGSTLTLKQNNKLDLEENIEEWDGRIDTHLVAESTADSITSIAASKWKDITADAYEDIIFSDISGDITTKSLTAATRDIKITAENGKLYAEGAISAGRDVEITATDESSPAIFLDENVDAGRDILLNNNTWAAAGITLQAGQDVISGDGKSVVGDGQLAVLADRDITLGGDVTTDGMLLLYADIDLTDGGDILAKGAITTTSDGDIEGWARNITVDGAIDSDGSLTLNAYNNITLNSSAESDEVMWLKADVDGDHSGDLWAKSSLDTFSQGLGATGENITVDGTSYSGAWINMTAGDNITLGDNATSSGNMVLTADAAPDTDGTGDFWAKGNLDSGGSIDIYSSDNTTILGGDLIEATVDITLHNNTVLNGSADQRIDAETGLLTVAKNIDKSTPGSMTLAGGSGINLGGNVTGTGLTAADSITLEDDVLANGADSQTFDAGAGALNANGTITKTDTGDLTLAGDEGIDLDGTVDVTAGSLTIENDFTAAGDLLANNKVNLDATAELDGAGDQRIDAETGALTAADNINKTTSGSLTLAGETGIYLAGDVSTNTTDGVFSMNHLIFEDAVTANGTGTHLNQTFTAAPLDAAAGSSVQANSTITKIDGGDLGTDLDGGNLTIRGGWQVNLDGDVVVEDGTLTVEADQDIYLGGNVISKGDMALAADADDDAEQWVGTPYAGLAGGDVTAQGNLTSTMGNITISAFDDTIYLNGDEIRAAGNVNLENNTVAADGILIHAVQGDVVVGVETETVDPLDYPGMPGLLPEVYTDTYLQGNGDLTVQAGSDVIVGGDLDVTGNLLVTAVDNVSVGNAYSDGNMNITADNGNITSGNLKRVYDLDPTNGNLVYNGGDISADFGDMALTATNGSISFKYAYSDGTMDMDAAGDIAAGVIAPAIAINNWSPLDEVVEIAQGGYINANDDMVLLAGNDIKAKWVEAYSDGTILMDAGHDILIGGVFPALAGYLYNIDGEQDTTDSWGTTQAEVLDVHKGGYVYTSDNSITLLAGNDIKLKRASAGDGDIVMDAGQDILVGGPAPHAVDLGEGEYGTAEFDKGGRLDAEDGGITLTASRDISLKMADADDDITMTAGQNLTLRTNPGDYGRDDRMESYTGDIRLRALNGDISIVEGYELIAGEFVPGYQDDEWVDAEGGGVSIIADEGKIYSPGGDDDTLNVTIVGNSDQAEGIGVELPVDSDRKAAIVLISKEDLNLGEGASLSASGMYHNTSEEFDLTGIDTQQAFDDYMESLENKFGNYIEKLEQGFEEYLGYDPDEIADFAELKALLEGYLDSIGGLTLYVDDRAAMELLDDGATLGGVIRNEGAPFDAAIYAASTDGDVDVSSPVSIMTMDESEGPDIPQGAMVIDALDTVSFGDLFEDSLANGDVGDRLEVVSRITEWLFQAVGRLPYPYGGGMFPSDYAYVLRGAGLDNLGITDGRAWVLEDPVPAAPLSREAGQAADEQSLGLDGCPVLVAAASAELGIPSETIEVSLANSYALNTDIQPCETCARLVNAAAILADENGSAMAAMNQVFNELAPASSPYSPEMASLIATAFAERVNDATQYATAIEYMDAFVNYIAVLNSEMGSPVGDSIAYTMQKYGSGVTGSDNANMAAFLAARLEAGETFGQ